MNGRMPIVLFKLCRLWSVLYGIILQLLKPLSVLMVSDYVSILNKLLMKFGLGYEAT